MFEDFHPLHNFLGVAAPNLLGVKPDSTIKNSVIIVRPEGENFMGREVFEGQFAIIPIIGVQPANPALQGIFTHILQKPLEPLIKNLVQKFGIGLVFTGQGKGLAHKIVGFLVHH